MLRQDKLDNFRLPYVNTTLIHVHSCKQCCEMDVSEADYNFGTRSATGLTEVANIENKSQSLAPPISSFYTDKSVTIERKRNQNRVAFSILTS